MCGHVGIAGNLEFKDEKTLQRLLILDYFRGMDSTGVAILKNSGDTSVIKLASHPVDLFSMSRFKSEVTGASSSVFLGHNRAATLGKVNGLNAHPFRYGHIIGAHNGTLDRSSWTALEELAGEKTDVDSAAIFAAIAKVGVEAAVSVMTEGSTAQTGAWALVWIDENEKTLNFLRNKHRPFWTAQEDSYKKLFWASEWPMIRGATDLSAQEYKIATNNNGYGYFETKVNQWYRIPLSELRLGNIKDIKSCIVKEVKGKAPLVYAASSTPWMAGAAGGYQRSNANVYGGSTTGSIPARVTIEEATRVDPFGDYFDTEELKAITVFGCQWCGADIDMSSTGAQGITIFEAENICLCNKCNGSKTQNVVYAPSAYLTQYIKGDLSRSKADANHHCNTSGCC